MRPYREPYLFHDEDTTVYAVAWARNGAYVDLHSNGWAGGRWKPDEARQLARAILAAADAADTYNVDLDKDDHGPRSCIMPSCQGSPGGGYPALAMPHMTIACCLTCRNTYSDDEIIAADKKED